MSGQIDEILKRLSGGAAKPIQDRLFVIEDKQVKIVGTRCPVCGCAVYPAKEYCPKCFEEMQEAYFGSRGTVFSHTTVYQSTKDYKGDLPYIIVKVLLEEICPFTSQLIGTNLQQIKVGQQVELTLSEFMYGSDNVAVVAPVFRLAE